MTERILTDITSRMKTDIPVLNHEDLSISGAVRSGSDIIIKYTGERRLTHGLKVYIQTKEGRIFEAIIGHAGSKGKLYASVRSGVNSYSS